MTRAMISTLRLERGVKVLVMFNVFLPLLNEWKVVVNWLFSFKYLRV